MTHHDKSAMGFAELLARAGAGFFATLARPARERLAAFHRLLTKWQHAVNLIGRADLDPPVFLVRHVADTLFLAEVLRQAGFDASRATAAGEKEGQPGAAAEMRGLDVGSGGGVPGLILSLLFPATRWRLCESSAKKCAFLKAAALEIAASNVEVSRVRIAPRPGPGDWDVVVGRAVVPALEWLKLGAGHVRTGGLLVSMLGPREAVRDFHLTNAARELFLREQRRYSALLEAPGLSPERVHRNIVLWRCIKE